MGFALSPSKSHYIQDSLVVGKRRTSNSSQPRSFISVPPSPKLRGQHSFTRRPSIPSIYRWRPRIIESRRRFRIPLFTKNTSYHDVHRPHQSLPYTSVDFAHVVLALKCYNEVYREESERDSGLGVMRKRSPRIANELSDVHAESGLSEGSG
jgi:hypothetical protein